MSLLFLTYGATHSGKTTFGEQLRIALGDSARIAKALKVSLAELFKGL